MTCIPDYRLLQIHEITQLLTIKLLVKFLWFGLSISSSLIYSLSDTISTFLPMWHMSASPGIYSWQKLTLYVWPKLLVLVFDDFSCKKPVACTCPCNIGTAYFWKTAIIFRCSNILYYESQVLMTLCYGWKSSSSTIMLNSFRIFFIIIFLLFSV